MSELPRLLAATLIAAAAPAALLAGKSILDFTRAGPEITKEIAASYKRYTVYAFARLTFWCLAINLLLAASGTTLYLWLCAALARTASSLEAGTVATLAVLLLAGRQFLHRLLYMPSSIAASYQYRLSRLYPLWSLLSPARLRLIDTALAASALVVVAWGSVRLLAVQDVERLAALAGGTASLLLLYAACARAPGARPRAPGSRPRRPSQRPNILMMGADTLRIDRFGACDYPRDLTPSMDRLATRGTLFTNTYVPLARTAPSLATLLTGHWPHRHRIRDNYVPDDECRLPVATLPQMLDREGYLTAAISDWSGADLGKLQFGFRELDTPQDQWNLKLYIRQGPMDLRLYLSLFTHNRFGKRFLPELYFLAGVPLTGDIGALVRGKLSDFAADDQPFFLMTFLGTTHVPFGVEYPYYLMFSDPDYKGESKFVMASLNDPNEIIRRQEADSTQFDISQIVNLYDACVRRFDDEVGKVVRHLESCGLSDDTILVIFGDHGIEFFENETWGQGNTVFGGDPSARVPLLIVDPRRAGARNINHIVRTVDLVPTLLELLGLPEGDGLDGRSLVPYLDNPAADLNLPAFQETGLWLGKIPGMSPDHLTYPRLLDLLDVPDKRSGTLAIKRGYQRRVVEAKDRMVRCGRWKLVYQPLLEGPRYQLFDLLTDPDCRHDVALLEPETFAALRARLHKWIREDPLMCEASGANGTTRTPIRAAEEDP